MPRTSHVLHIRLDTSDSVQGSMLDACAHAGAVAIDPAEAGTAQPVSQNLPDTDMELWDFGASQPPHAEGGSVEGSGATEAAEALQELEDFCKRESPV